jgi:hypothetical protein
MWLVTPYAHRALALTLFLLAGVPARACIDINEPDLASIREDDAVFAGTLLRYDTVSSPALPRELLAESAVLTVRVDEVLAGRVPRVVRMKWGNYAFGVPSKMDLNVPYLFGGAKHPDLPNGIDLYVAGDPCGTEHIIAATSRNVSNIRTLLAGKHVPYEKFEQRRQVIMETARRAYNERTRLRRYWADVVPLLVVVSVVLLASTAGIALWRKRKIQSAR